VVGWDHQCQLPRPRLERAETARRDCAPDPACPGEYCGLYFSAVQSRPRRLLLEWYCGPAGVPEMPNKYEREIEEILRNMDRTDDGQSLGDRIRAFNRPSPRLRLVGPRIRLRLSASEALLVVGIGLALFAAGFAYYFSGRSFTDVIGVIGVVGLLCLLLGLGVGWSERFGHHSSPSWRGQPAQNPRRFRPFSPIATQFRIMRLKWRYWRSRGR
jgi:hypothetical protein